MSRNTAYIFALAACAFLLAGEAAVAQTPAPAAPATGDAKDEMAYRAAFGRADDIRFLLLKGANANATNKEGLPVLLVAAGRKDAEAVNVVKALISGGANINAKDTTGQTALYYAAKNGNADIVDFLLKNRIDYYSMDNNGDIARTIAFRAGNNNIVDIMDKFVRDQTLQVNNAYQQNAAQAQQGSAEAQRLAAEQAEKAKKEAEAQAELQRKQDEEKREQYMQNLAQLGDKIYTISYNACAFQYWSFCQEANQTMDLPPDTVDETIANHKKQVTDTSLEVMQMFEAPPSYLDQIINPSKQRIFDELNNMPSRTWRRENGVGTLPDVTKRCNRIAKSWEISPPK